MTTVLLAEDELLVKIGIKSSIDWEKNGFNLIGEVSDGNEAMENIRKYNPQILLLDIKLPGMDGLDIMEKMKEEGFGTKVIIISGLDDFYTVKRAMQLGAFDYIHKPRMHYGDLLNILLKAQTQCGNQGAADACSNIGEAEPKVFLRKLLCDEEISDIYELSKKIFKDKCYCILYLSLWGIYKKNVNAQTSIIYRAVESMIDEFCHKHQSTYGIALKQGRYCLMMTAGQGEALYLRTHSMENAKALQSALKRFMNLEALVGISSVSSSYKEIQAMCGQAYQALEYLFFSTESLTGYGDIKRAGAREFQEVSVFAKKFSESARPDMLSVNLELFKNYCGSLRNNWAIDRRDLKYQIQNIIWSLMENDIEACERWIDSIHACGKLSEIESCYEEFINQMIKDGQKNLSNPVKEIVGYLNLHYPDNISLSLLSDKFFLSEQYISRVFKKETGENLLTYLNMIRVNRAKILLRSTDMKMYEIAEQTGFNSSVNFNYVFNRITGLSPKAYRDGKETSGQRVCTLIQ